MLHLEAQVPEPGGRAGLHSSPSGAAPHLRSAVTPARLYRVGALVWWTFREASTPLPELAGYALEHGFPTLFLGAPATPRMALRRALRALTVGHREWHADMLCDDEEATVATLEHWDPRAEPPDRPWRVALRLSLGGNGAARGLHVEGMAPLPFDTAAGPGQLSDGEAMATRVRERYLRELESVSATEIGRGLVAAFEDADAVELRRGLWFVPATGGAPPIRELASARPEVPANGIDLARAAAAYVRSVGCSSAGMTDFFVSETPPAGGAPPGGEEMAQVRHRLVEELADLASRVRQAPLIDAVRWPPLWHAVERFERRLGAFEVALGGDLDALRPAALDIRRQLLERAATAGDAFVKSVGREVASDLWLSLEKIRRGAAMSSIEELLAGERLLEGALPAARAGGFDHLAKRLCQLSQATVDLYQATLERPAAADTPVRIRHAALRVTLEPLFRALGNAAHQISQRARRVYPTLFERLESAPAG